VGTRANALLDHQVPDARNRTTVLAMLAPTTPSAMAIQNHWDDDDPCSPHDREDGWYAFPERDGMLSRDYLSYNGPGGLSIQFGEKAARIRARCRWRSFLTEEPLRLRYVRAFRRIARALGSDWLAYFPSSDEIDEAALYGGETLDGCMAMMQRKWGPSESSIESVSPAVLNRASLYTPSVWYFDWAVQSD
jgi:hypothetical protein